MISNLLSTEYNYSQMWLCTSVISTRGQPRRPACMYPHILDQKAPSNLIAYQPHSNSFFIFYLRHFGRICRMTQTTKFMKVEIRLCLLHDGSWKSMQLFYYTWWFTHVMSCTGTGRWRKSMAAHGFVSVCPGRDGWTYITTLLLAHICGSLFSAISLIISTSLETAWVWMRA